MNKKRLTLILLGCILIFTMISCKEKPIKEEENINTKTQYTILKDTIYETKVYNFKSNIKGPKVAIVGGIHGDEVAGWKAALKLLEKDDFIGEVLIIPMANILADNLMVRYCGQGNNGMYNGVKYTDLNRTFPGKIDGTVTEQICYAIVQTITDFDPLYVIDLHESRRSYTAEKGLLGDTVIYNNLNSCFMADDIINKFNKSYLEIGDISFAVDTSSPEGAFNRYWSSFEDKFVFTFETNRELDESKRINQQLNLIKVFFELIWN